MKWWGPFYLDFVDRKIDNTQCMSGLPTSELKWPILSVLMLAVVASVQGMGKTVELLACILAHPFQGPAVPAELVGHRVLISLYNTYTGLYIRAKECLDLLPQCCTLKYLFLRRKPMFDQSMSASIAHVR